ncbi:MAG: hypothetical protein ACOYLB_11835 [Phototrophicaceae bacterium]
MYTLITGEYFVVGMSPDADSIKFKAHKPKLWDNLTADDPTKFADALKAEDGIVTIRLEGIDALETHFTPPSLPTPKGLKAEFKDMKPPAKGNHHQNEKMGEQATTVFLSYMGYSNITWKRWGQNQWINQATFTKDTQALTITEKYKDAKPGYILTREAEKNGRPVGWVFNGKPPYADGTILNAKQVGELVDESANAHLIKKGVVYPYFFMTLPGAIRTPLMAAAKKAQSASKAVEGNVWKADKTPQGIEIPTIDALHDEAIVYPYLFRRIVKQWYAKNFNEFWDDVQKKRTPKTEAQNNQINMEGFFDEADPWIFIISDQDFVRLSSVLEVGKQTLKFTRYPYDIVFLS